MVCKLPIQKCMGKIVVQLKLQGGGRKWNTTVAKWNSMGKWNITVAKWNSMGKWNTTVAKWNTTVAKWNTTVAK